MHSFHLLKIFLVGAFCCAGGIAVQAQEIASGRAPVSVKNLDNLVQGRLYSPNYFPIKGSPFLTTDWSREDIRLQGNLYEEMPVWYDIYIDDLIMLNQQGANLYFIRLNREYVEYFSLGDRHFVNLQYSEFRELPLRPGYYEVALHDKITFLIKRTLEVKEEDNTLNSYFSRNDHRYLLMEDQLHRVRNRKTLLQVAGKARKKALAGFIKSQKIGLKKATDAEWLAVISFLNTLQPDIQ